MIAMPERKSRKQPGSRHKDRHMVSLPGELYRDLQTLAKRNNRPITWEIRAILSKELVSQGIRQTDESAQK